MQAFLKNIYFILGLPVFEGSFCTLQGTFRRNAYALRFQSPHICTASLTDSFVLLRFCFRYMGISLFFLRFSPVFRSATFPHRQIFHFHCPRLLHASSFYPQTFFEYSIYLLILHNHQCEYRKMYSFSHIQPTPYPVPEEMQQLLSLLQDTYHKS